MKSRRGCSDAYESFTKTGHTDKIDEVIGKGITYEEWVLYNPDNPLSMYPCDKEALGDPPTCADGCKPGIVWDEIMGELVCEWGCICDVDDVDPIVNSCDCPVPANIRKPAGCVQVDDDDRSDDGVIMAKIAVWDWSFVFKKNRITFTDAQGCWKVDEEYPEFKMKVIFENSNLKVRSMRYRLGFRVLRDQTREFNDLPYNNINIFYTEDADRREWAASHTLNTDFRFRSNATNDNIGQPRLRINYLLTKGNNNRDSAPMLQNVFLNSLNTAFISMNVPAFNDPFSVFLLPDITLNYRDGRLASVFQRIAFHEITHAAHYAQVGESFWSPYRAHVVVNNGDGTSPIFANGSYPGIVSLGEAVAEYFEDKYGSTPTAGEATMWRSNFIPAGMLWDLEDPIDFTEPITDPDNPTVILTRDDVTGFTPSMYFNVLTPNVRDIREFRDALSAAHLSSTPNTLFTYNNFVDAYDVFN